LLKRVCLRDEQRIRGVKIMKTFFHNAWSFVVYFFDNLFSGKESDIIISGLKAQGWDVEIVRDDLGLVASVSLTKREELLQATSVFFDGQEFAISGRSDYAHDLLGWLLIERGMHRVGACCLI